MFSLYCQILHLFKRYNRFTNLPNVFCYAKLHIFILTVFLMPVPLSETKQEEGGFRGGGGNPSHFTISLLYRYWLRNTAFSGNLTFQGKVNPLNFKLLSGYQFYSEFPNQNWRQIGLEDYDLWQQTNRDYYVYGFCIFSRVERYNNEYWRTAEQYVVKFIREQCSTDIPQVREQRSIDIPQVRDHCSTDIG